MLIKTASGEQFTVPITTENTVGEFKETIANHRGLDASTVKIICLGQILTDTKLMDEYKQKENEIFMVIMTGKPKKEEPKPTPVPTEPNSPPFELGGPPLNLMPAPAPVINEGPPANQAPQDVVGTIGSQGLANPQVAPPANLEELQQIPVNQVAEQFVNQVGAQVGNLMTDPDSVIDILMNDPMIQHKANEDPNFIDTLKDQVQNPNFLNNVLQMGVYLEQNNFFNNLNNQDIEQVEIEEVELEPEDEVPPEENPEDHYTAMKGTFGLTDDDITNVKTLVSMGGFNPQEVCQMYVVCDKNMEATASVLFEG